MKRFITYFVALFALVACDKSLEPEELIPETPATQTVSINVQLALPPVPSSTIPVPEPPPSPGRTEIRLVLWLKVNTTALLFLARPTNHWVLLPLNSPVVLPLRMALKLLSLT